MPAPMKIPFSYERIVRSKRRNFSLLVVQFSSRNTARFLKMQKTFAICFIMLIAVNCVTSRWLPTRSQEDRLDKLREMLKDLLESEIERSNYESKNIFKRDVGTQVETVQAADTSENLKEKLR